MGRRIIKAGVRITGTSGSRDFSETSAQPDLSQYWDRLKNLIPSEVSAIYLAGQGLIPSGQNLAVWIWCAVCLLGTVLFIANATKTDASGDGKKYPIDWAHVVVSSISFMVWVYALGGPFLMLRIYVPWIATLIMIGWTFLVPFIYKGASD